MLRENNPEISKEKEGRCIPCIVGVVVFVVIAVGAIALVLRSPQDSPLSRSQGEQPEVIAVDDIVQYGQILLTERINAGEDLSSGPCLDNNKGFPGWVIDIAHDPRQPIDDEPENQCSAFKKGKADKFIELSEDGNVIRIEPPVEEGNEEQAGATIP